MKRTAFVLGTAAAAALPARAWAGIVQDEIARAASASSGSLAMWARRMGPGEPIAYDADERFPTASVIKVVILVTLFQEGELTPQLFDRSITLKRSDFVDGSEILDAYNPGDSITVRKLANAMIAQSDNTASNVLINLFGMERIAQTIHHAGLAKTQLHRHFMDRNAIAHHSENLSTARDMGTLMYEIERGSREGLRTVASAASCRRMIEILMMQEDHDKIARGLPPGVPLANKTGEIDGVRNDIAIVDPFGDTPYVLAVLTKNLDDFSLGNIAIRRVASAVHEALY